MKKKSILAAAALLLVGCAGNLGANNTPPSLAPSTTVTHCVWLDAESDWLPPVGIGAGAVGTGLTAIDAADGKMSQSMAITAVVFSAGGLLFTAVGANASKSWHDQCVPREPPKL